ncbi:MAG: OmpA family protein [Campylobacterota bacterium]|nr:OmpA family protein [Campylobacterota bacterium]
MKYLVAILTLTFYLNASEFTYIEPIAVEEAPVKKAVESAPLDSDADGVLDREDRCPNTKSGETVDKFGCLLKEDSDRDGVPNEADKCPNTVLETKVDYRGCELDSDDDGIVDTKDKCPDTSKDFAVDGYGCPQTATLKVNFAPNKYNVSDELVSNLQDFALFLKANVGYQVIIYGYTDNIGSEEVNKKLSQNRANAVKETLSRYGIKRTRLTAIGKGEADPIANNKDKEGRAKNRRIEVELLQ